MAKGDSTLGYIAKFGECNTPPPDSFRIIGKGADYISLSWIPINAGAEYMIIAFEENPTGSWDTFSIHMNVTGFVHTEHNLSHLKRYKFKIATLCEDQTASNLTASTPPSGLIIELTLGGRTPINPQPVLTCLGIQYQNPSNNWTGFRVSKSENLLNTNYFEFSLTHQIPSADLSLIRVFENQIVLTDILFKWPDQSDPYLSSPYSIQVGIRDENDNIDPIGHVLVHHVSGINPTVEFCETSDWNPGFILEQITASKAELYLEGLRDDQISQAVKAIEFSIDNPIQSQLNIRSELSSNLPNANITLYEASSGKIVHQSNILQQTQVYSIDTTYLQPGCFILVIKNGTKFNTYKIIKI